jgi:hypothetical protein
MMEEFYLGDGVYASFEGYAVKLRAPRERGDSEIWLEPEHLKAINEFVKRNGWKLP